MAVKKKTVTDMPSVLSFDRKLEPSDALMHSGCWVAIDDPQAWTPIELIERRNRGVKSNFKKEVLDDEQELQKQIQEPNPVWGDDAALPHHHDTLKVSFTLRIIGDVGKPSACNKATYQQSLQAAVATYSDEHGFTELARRYACNIANGRFLWRNRVGAESIRIRVSALALDNSLIFDDYSLRDTDKDNEGIAALADLIAKGFSGDYTLLKVEAFAKLGGGQRIWPSQEMIMNIPKGEKSRHLFSLNGCAALHSQKVGNALRTIDDWYAPDSVRIAVEPFGSVTHQGVAMRKSKNDFYTLSNRWFVKGDTISAEEKHFVMAVLIRGGVFGESDKD